MNGRSAVNVEWEDIIVVWASTPLEHRVSKHFEGRGDDRVITVDRRGIAALAEAATATNLA